jgi:hypothetical protein
MNRLAGLFHKTTPPRRAHEEGKPLLNFPVLCLVQGAYYLALALGPLWGSASLEAGGGIHAGQLLRLVTAVAAAFLLIAAYRRQAATEIAIVAMGSALSLAALDVLHVLLRALSPLYLLDTMAEALFLAAWVRLLAPEKHGGARAAVRLPSNLHELPD